jgi:hypothetical protein
MLARAYRRETMKLSWFHLMPYRFLPEDFKEKYRSVWVDVPSELYDAEKTHDLPRVPG